MARVELKAPTQAGVWMHSVGVGAQVFEGNTIMTLEVMKTELNIDAPCDGTLVFLADQGIIVNEGDVVAIIETA